jgi:hypothetical protein
MKKITIIYLALLLSLPVLLQAQYLGGNGRGDVMLELLNSPLTNVWNNSNTIPTSYSLEQNYPNPFNPSTNIKFNIPAVSFPQALSGNPFVTLKIVDILGREVATLVNEKLNAGTYSVDWNASEYPSGIYFYRLQTEGYTEVKKMSLIK